MPTPTKGPRLGGSPAHERIILANLASQLFEHGRITTTEAKAKRVRPLAEKLISKAKRGDLHSRRLCAQTITDKTVLHILFTEIAPKMAGREGGYLRITKIGNRKGDNAPMAVIEVIEESVEESRANKEKAAKKAATKAPAKKAAKKATPAEPTSEELAAAEEPTNAELAAEAPEVEVGDEAQVVKGAEAEVADATETPAEEAKVVEAAQDEADKAQ